MLGLIVLLLMILVVVLFVSSLPFQPEQKMWLSKSDIHQLAKSLEANKTLTDEQVREIVTMQLRNVVHDFGEPTSDQIPSTPTSKRSAWGALLLIGPLVVAFALAFYLLVFFYPSALFLWGDAVGRYEHLKHTRNILWSAVIGVTFLFPLTYALRAGLLSYLAQH
jgi:ABC-type dipeptide/oligopeptide/nickel transport system permease component